ncbi:hypothetical protein BV509_04460 [Rhodovulum sulfidophilum]|uniref:Uncharacterized protein n=1 Tax=Rhodovulum visakhapatnamense TaxID=364297 RepID=A0A4R8FLS7_9RHOB|nr:MULTISPECIES: hypothetical protein [Rhodovulum]OLS43657.1 hypothetical protein BV509_04460 [Rhodovulum sulfidophilum]TDX24898.1 hypothetical protein EV657_12173 [Rhodovulum visakhapatnamense]
MALISDILLIAGALGATLYCYVLARRLRRFNDLEKGMGGAIAVLSAQVDDMTKVLKGAQFSAKSSTDSLEGLTGRAEDVARRLELLVAAMHDLPEDAVPDTARKASRPAPAAEAPSPAAPQTAAPTPAAPASSETGDTEPTVLFRRNVREAAE